MNIPIPCPTTHYQSRWFVSMCVVCFSNCDTWILKSFCQAYDIVCLVESKLGFLDSFKIQNFDSLHLLNREKTKSRSGGIAVLVKDTISDHIKALNSSSKNVLWFTVNNSFLSFVSVIWYSLYTT